MGCCPPRCGPCPRKPPFPHSGEYYERRARLYRYYQRYDNFYNDYNTDCQMIRRVCCNPFEPRPQCSPSCCGRYGR